MGRCGVAWGPRGIVGVQLPEPTGAERARLLRRLLAVDDLRIESSELAWQAVGLYEKGKADFADYVIGLSHSAQGAEITYTFDRQASHCKLFKLVGR